MTDALALALLVALVYMLVIRLIDLNEKEPLWAIALVFLVGAFVAGLTRLFVDSSVLELQIFTGALITEIALLVAIVIGVGLLGMIGRSRGWSEVSGLMDGVVYGAAAGLGFSTGLAFVREITFGSELTGAAGSGGFGQLWGTVLAGLALGLFGGIVGAGIAGGMLSRDQAKKFGLPVVGLVGAVVLHSLYTWLARAGALGSSGGFRTALALVFPIVVIVVLMFMALGREKRALKEELNDEVSSGAVTEDEIVLLQSVGARRQATAMLFFRADFDGWLALRQLHNRQVQLALSKQRARSIEGEDRAEIDGEIERLRAAIGEARGQYQAAVGPRRAKGVSA